MARPYTGEATRLRPRAPGCAVWLGVGWLFHPQFRAHLNAMEPATNACEVAPADVASLTLHGTVQSATTWRNAWRVSGGAYVSPSRLLPRCFSSLAGPCFRSSLKLYLVPITELADTGFGSLGRMKSKARAMRPLRRRTTRATSPAD
jgi:hypothetical protein